VGVSAEFEAYFAKNEARAKRNKAKLAVRLKSNEKLICALVYYLTRMVPGVWIARDILHHRWIDKRNWSVYLDAARRVLNMQAAGSRLRLWPNVRDYLSRFGLDNVNWSQLNPDLSIDARIMLFSETHKGLLSDVKSFLLGQDIPVPNIFTPRTPKKAPQAATIQAIQEKLCIPERPLRELSESEIAQREREEIHAEYRRQAQERNAHRQGENKKKVNVEHRRQLGHPLLDSIF